MTRWCRAPNESLDLYGQGYELGGYSLLELTEAQNMALGLRRELIDVATELHELRIQLIQIDRRVPGPGSVNMNRNSLLLLL